eukprot:Gb_41668 [translate_table: standard]
MLGIMSAIRGPQKIFFFFSMNFGVYKVSYFTFGAMEALFESI